MAELVVITGGSYAGKTTVIRALADRGHAVIPEAAFEVIEQLTQEMGLAAQATWRRNNVVAFQRRIAQLQLERERIARASSEPFVFCDRGVFDGLAYCHIAGETWPDELHEHAASVHYAHAFVLDTLSNFDDRQDSGRIHSRDDSVEVSNLLVDLYSTRADAVTRVPEMPITKRVEMILARHASR